MKAKTILLLLTLLMPFCFAQTLWADTVTWDGEGGDGLWSTPLNWDSDVVPQSTDDIVIPVDSDQIYLDINFTLYGQLDIFGGLSASSTKLTVNSGVTLTLDSTLLPSNQYERIVDLNNGAIFTNEGIITGVSNPSPQFTLYANSAACSFINNNEINTIEFYVLSPSGTRDGTVTNNGTMNYVDLGTLFGTINNNGLMDNVKLDLQQGDLVNNVTGTINIDPASSQYQNRFLSASLVDNHGSLTNTSTINNQSTFNNLGTFDNTTGVFINNCDLNLGFVGTFNDSGTFSGNPITTECAVWDNDNANELWSDPLNWLANQLPAATDDIVINTINDSDTTVTIDTDVTIQGELVIRNSAGSPVLTTLIIQAGSTLTNNNSISMSNSTVFNNQGTVVNNNSISMSDSTVFNNLGTVVNNSLIRGTCNTTLIDTGSFTGNPFLGLCSTWDGGGGDGLWSNPLNWVGDILPRSGEDITIPEDSGQIYIDTDLTLYGQVNVDGGLSASPTRLTVNSGVTLTLNSTLLPAGDFENIIILDRGVVFTNEGVIAGANSNPNPQINLESGSPASSFINNNVINSMELSVWSPSGTRDGTVTNNGTMNYVDLGTLFGTIQNNGLMDNVKLDLQQGDLVNNSAGTINIDPASSQYQNRFLSSSLVNNHGSLINYAIINNESTFNNFGTLDNTSGVFDNPGTFVSMCGSTLLGTISGNPPVDDTTDNDGDGVPDTCDAFPNDPAASDDTDGDGFPDSWNPGKTQSDSTTGLVLDAFPADPAASTDTDSDGYPDSWNPGKTQADSTTGLALDAFPFDPTEQTDTDGDGLGDNSDAFPSDPTETTDCDNDGIGDNADTSKFCMPTTLNYQGYLTDNNGTPITGSPTITFRFYDVPTGGAPHWDASFSVSVLNGVYSVILGESPGPVISPTIFSKQIYLGVQIAGEASEMMPRNKFSAVPYALKSGSLADGATTNYMRFKPTSVPSSPVAGDMYYDSSDAFCVYMGGGWNKLAGTGNCGTP